jgi:hypothetical protein
MPTLALACCSFAVALAFLGAAIEASERSALPARRIASYIAQPTQRRPGSAERRLLASVRHATVRA